MDKQTNKTDGLKNLTHADRHSRRGYNTHKNIEKTKSKPTGHSSSVRTAHTSVHMIGYNCGTQYSTDNLPSYPPDSHHSADVVYWRGGVKVNGACCYSTHDIDTN